MTQIRNVSSIAYLVHHGGLCTSAQATSSLFEICLVLLQNVPHIY